MVALTLSVAVKSELVCGATSAFIFIFSLPSAFQFGKTQYALKVREKDFSRNFINSFSEADEKRRTHYDRIYF